MKILSVGRRGCEAGDGWSVKLCKMLHGCVSGWQGVGYGVPYLACQVYVASVHCHRRQRAG